MVHLKGGVCLLSQFNGCSLGTGPDRKSAWSFLFLKWWESLLPTCNMHSLDELHPEWYATDATVESLWKWTFSLINSHKVFMRVITPFIWHHVRSDSFREGANSFSAVIFTFFTDRSSENLPNECEKNRHYFLKIQQMSNGKNHLLHA